MLATLSQASVYQPVRFPASNLKISNYRYYGFIEKAKPGKPDSGYWASDRGAFARRLVFWGNGFEAALSPLDRRGRRWTCS